MENNYRTEKNAVTWLRILYPIWALVGMFSLMYVPSTLIDKTNPELTAENILQHEFLFRLGISGSIFTQLVSIVVVWFLYRLFNQSHREEVLLTGILNFLGMPMAMLGVSKQLSVLDVLDDPNRVIFLLNQQTYDTMIATVFWGLWLLPLGYIVIKSSWFPSVIGWLLVLAGGAYFISAFLYFLGLKDIIAVELLDYLTFGELIWMLWVMIVGVRWKSVE